MQIESQRTSRVVRNAGEESITNLVKWFLPIKLLIDNF